METNFVDYVKIFFRSGNGGPGSVHFLHIKNNDKGGPDGGDGGRGAHIILKGNKQLWTLLHLKFRKHIHADDGENGRGKQQSGKSGEDVLLDVPLGTVARWEDTGEKICEIIDEGQQEILLPGGKGGLGNQHFKSPTRQAPLYAQPGIPGKEGWIILELKVLADVGLVGFPNAGKSTLLSVVSAAKPEIANYAFTTLVPQLGIVGYHDRKSFVMADLPGIIEGAHEGKGLGHRFLRHIERNSLLLFMIPCDSNDIKNELKILKNELKLYNPDLLLKPKLLAITKCDLLDAELKKLLKKELPKGINTVFISSATGEGIAELKDVIWKTLND